MFSFAILSLSIACVVINSVHAFQYEEFISTVLVRYNEAYNSRNGKTYLSANNSGVTFDEAKKACSKFTNGTMVQINTINEYLFIKDYLTDKDYWLGSMAVENGVLMWQNEVGADDR